MKNPGRYWRQPTWQYGLALVVFAAVSLLGLWLERWTGYQAISLVYLLAVVLLALVVGRGPIVFGAILTAMGWSYLFAPPRFSFEISGFYDQEMVAMYFLVALTVGQLTAVLRAQRVEERQREEKSRALYLLGRELADSADVPEMVAKARAHVGQVFNAEAAVFLPALDRLNCFWRQPGEAWQQEEREQQAATWALANNQPAGRGTAVSSDCAGLYLPLSASSPATGVLAVRYEGGDGPTVPQRQLLVEFARHIALALDRQRLREAEMNAKLLKESERLGRTLLNSVSHELRTPLSTLISATHALRLRGPLTPAQQEVAAEIDSAANRLNRVVQSLLSAARLQSGLVRPKLDWCDVSDVVKVAIRNLGQYLCAHPVEIRVPAGMPLVKADFVLLEQAVSNILLNAAAHTPPGTPVIVIGRLENDNVALEIADRGPGIAAEHLDRMFDPFHRTPNARPGGTGLGLHIVKGFVEAQGGQVRAANREGGGASFTMVLPANPTDLLMENVA